METEAMPSLHSLTFLLERGQAVSEKYKLAIKTEMNNHL